MPCYFIVFRYYSLILPKPEPKNISEMKPLLIRKNDWRTDTINCGKENGKSKFTCSSHYFPGKSEWGIAFLPKNNYWGVIILRLNNDWRIIFCGSKNWMWHRWHQWWIFIENVSHLFAGIVKSSIRCSID